MKKTTKVLSGIALISLFCILFGSCAKGPVDVSVEIKKANKVFMTAVSSRDTSALRALYTSDAKLFPANSDVVEGPQAIVGFWNAVMGMGIQKAEFETVTAQRIGDIAIEEGKYKLYVAGDHMVDQGKYMVTWKNEDGKWKVQRDIWNNSTPAPQPRAMAKDTVMMVMNYVKADKVAQFEEFNTNYLALAATEFNAQTKKTVRTQKSAVPNKDGSYTYIYLMDPYAGTNDYDIFHNLMAKYGEEKAGEYMKMYSDCLKDGKSQVMLTVETGW